MTNAGDDEDDEDDDDDDDDDEEEEDDDDDDDDDDDEDTEEEEKSGHNDVAKPAATGGEAGDSTVGIIKVRAAQPNALSDSEQRTAKPVASAGDDERARVPSLAAWNRWSKSLKTRSTRTAPGSRRP